MDDPQQALDQLDDLLAKARARGADRAEVEPSKNNLEDDHRRLRCRMPGLHPSCPLPALSGDRRRHALID